MTAKAHRSWDADIDRIIAKQQEKRRLVELAALGQTDPDRVANDAQPPAAELSAASAVEEENDDQAQAAPQRTQTQNGKRPGRRVAQRGKHFIPEAFVTLPKFAAATTSTLLRLR
jgi:hypothetical protein